MKLFDEDAFELDERKREALFSEKDRFNKFNRLQNLWIRNNWHGNVMQFGYDQGKLGENIYGNENHRVESIQKKCCGSFDERIDWKSPVVEMNESRLLA